MWTIIILAIIGAIVGIVIIWGGIGDLKDILIYVSAAVMGAPMGAIIGIAVAVSIPAKTKLVVDAYKIESLQDNNSIHGGFFLGCGSVNGEMRYVFYYETDGGYKMKQLRADDVLIKYADDNPRIEVHKKIRTDDLINKFSLRGGCGYCVKYIIYVPKGTIKQNYVLDAQ